MSVLIVKNGILDTVQDLGRAGFRGLGINLNGAMDRKAVRLLNILLGNAENTGVLEMHFPAPVLQFEENAIVALGGADFSAKLNETAVENWHLIFAQKKDVLKFENRKSGARLYLAVKGGFKIQKWLGSVSTNLKAQVGGFGGRALRKGDKLDFNLKPQSSNLKLNRKIAPDLTFSNTKAPVVRAIPGAQWEQLTDQSQTSFLTEKFTIKNESDRMGFRLRGEKLETKQSLELVSSAVNFGTIQLLPDGQMIILMADHQTTGGYGLIANVISADLPVLAQLNANDAIGFKIVSPMEAERAILEFETKLGFLRTAVRFL